MTTVFSYKPVLINTKKAKITTKMLAVAIKQLLA